MTPTLLTLVLIVAMLVVVVVIVYYFFRLSRAHKMLSVSGAGSSSAALAPEAPRESGDDELRSPRPVIWTVDARVGLKDIYPDVIFMRRGKAGEVSFQIGDKPSMPVKFILDPKGRKALQEVAARADAEFGSAWTILAAENAEGKLTMTRLA